MDRPYFLRYLIAALLVDRESVSAVQLPALLGRIRAERLLLAVADHAYAIRRNARRHQRRLRRLGTVLAENQVVLVRSALVAVSADHHLDLRVRIQIVGIFREDRLRVSADIVGVVV